MLHSLHHWWLNFIQGRKLHRKKLLLLVMGSYKWKGPLILYSIYGSTVASCEPLIIHGKGQSRDALFKHLSDCVKSDSRQQLLTVTNDCQPLLTIADSHRRLPTIADNCQAWRSCSNFKDCRQSLTLHGRVSSIISDRWQSLATTDDCQNWHHWKRYLKSVPLGFRRHPMNQHGHIPVGLVEEFTSV